jgi:hypothetical protein
MGLLPAYRRTVHSTRNVADGVGYRVQRGIEWNADAIEGPESFLLVGSALEAVFPPALLLEWLLGDGIVFFAGFYVLLFGGLFLGLDRNRSVPRWENPKMGRIPQPVWATYH